MRWHRMVYPDPVTDFNPTIPVEFAGLVERLMHKEPHKRPASAEALRQTLLPWADPNPHAFAAQQTDQEIIEELDERQRLLRLERNQSSNSEDEAGEPNPWTNYLLALGFIFGLVLLVGFLQLLRR